MVIFGLTASAISSLIMGFVNEYALFFGGAMFVGLFANAGGPASGAMVADLLPEEKRAQGYGVLRVMHNLAVTVGPAIGGLLAARSFLLLFIIDAIASIITAFLVFILLPETKPALAVDEIPESVGKTFAGYGRVFRDGKYILFLCANMLMVLAYMQMNGSLPVYLRDVHQISAQGFGYILSLNAGMVVLFQFAITRRIECRPTLSDACVGDTPLRGWDLACTGWSRPMACSWWRLVIITIGEMLTAPTGQSIAASLAPEDMRGRYMAIFGFSWTLPNAVGLYLAGLIMDNSNPDYVWFAAAGVAMLAAIGFYFLNARTDWDIESGSGSPLYLHRKQPDPKTDSTRRRKEGSVMDSDQKEALLRDVEAGKVDIQEALRQLEGEDEESPIPGVEVEEPESLPARWRQWWWIPFSVGIAISAAGLRFGDTGWLVVDLCWTCSVCRDPYHVGYAGNQSFALGSRTGSHRRR